MRGLVGQLVIERDVSAATAKAWLTAVGALVRWGGPMTPQQAADRLSEFVAWRASFGSPYTASFYRRTLMGLLRQAEEMNLCTLPKLVRKVRVPEHTPRGFSDDEVRLLIGFADPMQRAAILLVRFCALRRGDVFRVRWPQVGQDGILRLVMGKNGRRHSVRIPDAVIEACRRVRAIDDDRLAPYPYTMSAWSKSWAKLGERAGVNVTDRGLQALRRVAASLVARDHGDVEAARLLGHADGSGLAVFRRYYRLGEITDRPPPSPPPLQ